MAIPPNMIGNIYDEQTQQVVRRLFTRLTETQLWALKRLIVSDAIANLSEDQALDYLRMIDEELEARLQSPFEKLQKHEEHLQNMTSY